MNSLKFKLTLHVFSVYHKVVRSKSATGPLSTAAAIADCITQIHREALETANRVKVTLSTFTSNLPIPKAFDCKTMTVLVFLNV